MQRLGDVDLDLLDHPEYPKFTHATRVHFKFLLKIRNWRELSPQLPACRPLTLVELYAFAMGFSDRIRITEENYRFDFMLPCEHIFNLEAMSVFAASFLQHVGLGRYDLSTLLAANLLDLQSVRAAIYPHVKVVKERFLALSPAPPLAPPAPVFSPRGMRKTRLFAKRDVEVRTAYPQHSDLLSRAGVSVVSSDESSDESGSLEVISPDWRSAALQAWLRSVDISISRRQSLENGARSRPVFSFSTPRRPSDRIHVGAIPPPRLPHNCYNPNWLATRSAEEIVALEIEDEAYDLTPLASFRARRTGS